MPPPIFVPAQEQLQNRFVVVTATDWGQGKTDAAMELVDGLRERGHKVGGFCIRHVYTPTPEGFRTEALEVLLLRTNTSVRVARRGYVDDEAVDFRSGRRDGLRVGMEGTFYLNRQAIAHVLESAIKDFDDPAVTAYVLDEVGPLLFKSTRVKRKREKRSVPFYNLALNLVDNPKPFTCLIFSDPDMQAEEALGVRKHIQSHPNRLHDRVSYWRLTPDNFRVLGGEILETAPSLKRRLVPSPGRA